jgi:hypothetical protein
MTIFGDLEWSLPHNKRSIFLQTQCYGICFEVKSHNWHIANVNKVIGGINPECTRTIGQETNRNDLKLSAILFFFIFVFARIPIWPQSPHMANINVKSEGPPVGCDISISRSSLYCFAQFFLRLIPYS